MRTSRGLRADQADGVEKDATRLQETEGEETNPLKDDVIDVEISEVLN